MVDCTVIIPCHNQGMTIRQAVESVLDADKIIIADDCSDDMIHEQLVSECTLLYPDKVIELKLNHDVPIGVCAMRNLLISEAYPSKLIVPLDADDYFIPGGLKQLVDAWQPGTFVYPGWIEHESGLEFFPPPPGMLKQKHIGHATMVFSWEDWRRVKGYRPEFNVGAEDWMFALHLESIGVKPVALQKLCYTYRKSNSGRAAATYRRANIVRQLMKEFLSG